MSPLWGKRQHVAALHRGVQKLEGINGFTNKERPPMRPWIRVVTLSRVVALGMGFDNLDSLDCYIEEVGDCGVRVALARPSGSSAWKRAISG